MTPRLAWSVERDDGVVGFWDERLEVLTYPTLSESDVALVALGQPLWLGAGLETDGEFREAVGADNYERIPLEEVRRGPDGWEFPGRYSFPMATATWGPINAFAIYRMKDSKEPLAYGKFTRTIYIGRSESLQSKDIVCPFSLPTTAPSGTGDR